MIVEIIKRGDLCEQFYEDVLSKFCAKFNIDVKHVTIDLRKTKNEYVTDGLFGEFIDMYKNKRLYTNPHNFIEYHIYESDDLAHIMMHELMHCHQINTGQMIIKSPNKLIWKGEIHDKVPFSVDLFNKIKDENPQLAEEYHWTALPWEKDAYKIPEEYNNKLLCESFQE